MKARTIFLAVVTLFPTCLAQPAFAGDGSVYPSGLTAEAVSRYYADAQSQNGGMVTQFSGGSANVQVIVNSSLYAGGLITASLNQYVSDIQAFGYNVTVTTTAFSTASDLRSHLAGCYNSPGGLAGAVFIGDLPIQHFEHNYEMFACDLYYMDLDGSWSDIDGNGTYDKHSGSVAPEIWMGRLTASPLTGLHAGRTEASLLNSYFQKNHAYRQGQLALPSNGLTYVDDDWRTAAKDWGKALATSVTGTVTVVNDNATTTAADYKNRLQNDQYESLLLGAHSSPAHHSFKVGTTPAGGMDSYEIQNLNPQVFFYNLFACSNADYETGGYMAGEYVFGTDYGLLAVGSTKTGSMCGFQFYYNPLGAGKTFGQAFFDWWTVQADGGFIDPEIDWLYGMTMIGDPLLVTQAYIPEPVTMALVVLGLGGILLRRRGSAP